MNGFGFCTMEFEFPGISPGSLFSGQLKIESRKLRENWKSFSLR